MRRGTGGARWAAVPYFDHNATSPLVPAAREAWVKAQDEAWQNPSSLHRAGVRVGLRLQAAREKLALVFGCDPARVIFTSGATEAVDAIMQHLSERLEPAERIAISHTEHPATWGAAGSYLAKEQLVGLPSNYGGQVVTERIAEALAQGAKAVVVMAANNETGVIQPWREIAAQCRAAGAAYVCDATQWLGKLPADGLAAADWVFGSAHKFGGPKGVGFLLRPKNENGFVMRRGGGQEAGQRGGTEDFPGIAAMVAALLEAEQKKVMFEDDRLRVRQAFEAEIVRRLDGTRVLAPVVDRLWNTVALVLPHGDATRWVAKLDKRGCDVSTGSACASGKDKPSHVLAAMGVPGEEARRTIRISSSWETTPADWQALANALVEVAAETKPPANVIQA